MKLPFQIDLKDKVVVVTGAGGVLCSMFAAAVAETGAKVALLDLNEEEGRVSLSLKATTLKRSSKTEESQKDMHVMYFRERALKQQGMRSLQISEHVTS